jgi:hypothetical protein
VSNSSIVAALQAETLLENSHILTQISTLKDSLKYKTGGEYLSFDDFFISLENQVDNLPKLKLESVVATGTENQYIIQLVTALEKALDDCDRVGQKVIHYEAKLKDAAAQVKKMGAAFGVWYTLAAVEVVTRYEIPLPASQLRALADAEFSKLMDNLDVSVNSLISAVKSTSERLKQHKRTQVEKFNLGKDQANASWTSNFPSFGETVASEGGTELIDKTPPEEPEPEEVPAFISKRPQIHTEPLEEVPTVKVDPVTGLPKIIVNDSIALIQDSQNPDFFTAPVGPTTLIVKTEPVETVTVDEFSAALGATEVVAPVKEKRQHSDVELVFVTPDTAQNKLVKRAKEGQPDKIHCVVCERRIRIGQDMFERDGGWAHAVATDCVERREQPRGGGLLTRIEDKTHQILREAEEIPPETKPLEEVVFQKDIATKPGFEIENDTVVGQMEKEQLTAAKISPDTKLDVPPVRPSTVDEQTKAAVPIPPTPTRKRIAFLEEDEVL